MNFFESISKFFDAHFCDVKIHCSEVFKGKIQQESIFFHGIRCPISSLNHTKYYTSEYKKKERNVSETYMPPPPPMVQNSGLSSL